jgi:ferredoxin
MAVVRSSLPAGANVLIEDFDASPPVKAPAAEATAEQGGTVTIRLERKKASVPRVAGETLLESARRAGLSPPFSCEAGNCGTCMAKLIEGAVTMRTNDVLEEDEIADGYVLTCQAVPDTASVLVEYE